MGKAFFHVAWYIIWNTVLSDYLTLGHEVMLVTLLFCVSGKAHTYYISPPSCSLSSSQTSSLFVFIDFFIFLFHYLLFICLY